MRSIRTLAICAAFAVALGGSAGATGEEVLDTVDAAVEPVIAAAEGLSVPWQVVPKPPTTTKVFKHNTDWIAITDRGSGPSVSKVGAFAPSAGYWDCETLQAPGAPVTVRCTARPVAETGVIWKCDAMDVTAKSLTNHRHVHNWGQGGGRDFVNEAQATVNELIGGRGSRSAAPAAGLPTAPNPDKIHWGQAAGVLSCDDAVLETETADRNNKVRTASGVFGIEGVTVFVCEARLAKGDASAPITPYSVNCLDPGAPGVE